MMTVSVKAGRLGVMILKNIVFDFEEFAPVGDSEHGEVACGTVEKDGFYDAPAGGEGGGMWLRVP